LAQTLDALDSGKFRSVRFTEPQLRELRYAALLHDFGKIGVRENVLVKAKKLFPEEVERIRMRADFIRRTIQWETAEAKTRALRELLSGHAAHDASRPCACGNPDAVLQELSDAEARRVAELDGFLETVERAIEPARMPEDLESSLRRFAGLYYHDIPGSRSVWLKSDEMIRLLIPRGTLSAEERGEIESHVTHTYKFLSRIPWTRDLKQIPLIAYAHHEKLDGKGYPRGLDFKEIPLPSQIMTICDIYDALTASDRPYKKAIPCDKALDILGMEVKDGKIDPDLYRVYLDAKIYAP
jgi:hypothetical protein